jgi:hypothetical protein
MIILDILVENLHSECKFATCGEEGRCLPNDAASLEKQRQILLATAETLRPQADSLL